MGSLFCHWSFFLWIFNAFFFYVLKPLAKTTVRKLTGTILTRKWPLTNKSLSCDRLLFVKGHTLKSGIICNLRYVLTNRFLNEGIR